MVWNMREIRKVVRGVDSGLVGLYSKRTLPGRRTPPKKTDAEKGQSPRQGNSGILSGCPEQGMSSICLYSGCESVRFTEVRNTVNNNRPTCSLLLDKGDFTRFKFFFSLLIYLFWQNYAEIFFQCPCIPGWCVDSHLQ